jgi:predicted ABC-class ATPase
MRSGDELEALLHTLDGKGYGAYKRIRGSWELDAMTLRVDHVQGDPFAAPTRVAVVLDPDAVGLDAFLVASEARRTGVAALLARRGAAAARRMGVAGGSGRSGEIAMAHPGQVVREQTALRIDARGGVEARLTVGLPARGRRIRGGQAAVLLLEALPTLVRDALAPRAHPLAELRRAACVNEDAEALRDALTDHGLVAFVADGACLPRRSGVDDRPLAGEAAVPFTAPEELRVTLETPHAGPVAGLGVPEGVTLIAGGGFHGKSTLLRALELGVWNHAPDDGRAQVVARRDAVKIRADDGRPVRGVDISPWIGRLPGGEDTRRFTTLNASGSTSQAAALAEALEVGTSLLLVDEDTAATNFMIRDRRMQALVPAKKEPITPFVDRVRALHRELGVSTVLVVGGSGDYLDVADTVVVMDAYRPVAATARAREVAAEHPTGRQAAPDAPLALPTPRVPVPGSVDTSRGRRRVHVRTRGATRLTIGRTEVSLDAVEQLRDPCATRSVARAVAALVQEMDGTRTVRELLEALEADVAAEGLDLLTPGPWGDLAAFRRHDVAAALNRLPTLDIV